MPLTNNAILTQTAGKKNVPGWATTISTTISGRLPVIVSDTDINGTGYVLQEEEVVYTLGGLYDSFPTVVTSVSCTSFLDQLIKSLYVNQASGKVVTLTPLNQAHGKYTPEINPVKKYTEVRTFEVHPTAIKQTHFRQAPIGLKINTDARVVHPGLNHSVNITQDDETGPSLLNIIPPSGTTYNNPATPITFHIVDEQGSFVVQPSIFLWVQGIQVISGGISVCPPLFGTAFVQKITDSDYLFTFNQAEPFDPEVPVVVSGYATDNHIPVNTSNYLYSYRVWKTGDLSASFQGLPDGQAPYLVNQDPLPGQIEVPVYSNISFDIVDDHTGLDFDSVLIYVNDELLVSGSNNMNPTFASTTLITLSGGQGRRFVINPLSDFEFSEQVTLDIQARDKYTPAPNYFSTTYSFLTQTNTQLVASGLQIETEEGFLDVATQTSYPTVNSGTNFKITFTNLIGLGISTSGSYISLNGGLVPSTFVSISGNNSYDVYFTLTPDYTTDCNLKFHVEQDTLSSGIIVAKDFTSSLLWGAEFCYDPESKFSYDTEIPVVIQVQDTADLATTSSLAYKFKTVPPHGQTITASIVGIDTPRAELLSYIASINPFFEYGKEMELTIEAEDYSGNLLSYSWKFTIEEKP